MVAANLRVRGLTERRKQAQKIGLTGALGLSRFELKVKFDFLCPAQAQSLFDLCYQNLGLEKDNATNGYALNYLTARDFAAVVRRSNFLPVCSAEALMKAIQKECSLKKIDSGRSIGFLSAVDSEV